MTTPLRNHFFWAAALFIFASPVSAETLTEALAERAAQSKGKVPVETAAVMEKATLELAKSEIIAEAPQVGDVLPDATLLTAAGEAVVISKVLSGKPAIVTFYRGGWCPYCNIQLLAYQKHLAEIQELGGQLLAISPELPTEIERTTNENNLSFPVLTDTNNAYARTLGIVFPLPDKLKAVYQEFGIDLVKNQGNDAWELPLAATFVVDSERTIVYAFVDVDYKKRAEPSELVEQLRKLKE